MDANNIMEAVYTEISGMRFKASLDPEWYWLSSFD